MPVERLAPDALLEQTNLSGSVSAVQDDPDAPDGSWLTAPGNNRATAARVSFPTPSGPLEGTQEFRVLVRKTAHSTNPTCAIELYANGSLVATLVSGQSVSSTSGTVVSATWDGAAVADAALVECRVAGTPGGGNPGNRASLEVGAIEWNAAVAEPQGAEFEAHGSASGTGSATLETAIALAAAGLASAIGAAALATSITVGASGQAQGSGAADLETAITLAASGTGQGTGTADLQAVSPIELAAQGSATGTGTAALETAITLGAGGGGGGSGSAALNTGINLEATGASAAAGAADLETAITLQSSGTGRGSGAADLVLAVGLEAHGSGSGQGTASLETEIHLAAQGAGRGIGTAVLAAGTTDDDDPYAHVQSHGGGIVSCLHRSGKRAVVRVDPEDLTN